MTVSIGEKYYYYTTDDNGEDKLNIFRILKVRKNEVIGVLNDKTRMSINNNELKTYTLLKPDGYLTLSVVELGDKSEDVIISISKTTENNTLSAPFAVCRQSVLDVFANQIMRDDLPLLIGTSVNQNTCPTNVDFKMLLACDNLKYYKIIACYMDDKLDDVLKLIDTTKFDEVLSKIYHRAPAIVTKLNTKLPVHGFCKSLRELIEYNDFELDYLAAFGIHKVDMVVKFDENTLSIDDEQKKVIENIVGKYMFNTYVVKYDKTINTSLIKRNHIFVSDKNDDIYIIAYDSGDHLDITQREMYKYVHEAMYAAKRNLAGILPNKNFSSK